MVYKPRKLFSGEADWQHWNDQLHASTCSPSWYPSMPKRIMLICLRMPFGLLFLDRLYLQHPWPRYCKRTTSITKYLDSAIESCGERSWKQYVITQRQQLSVQKFSLLGSAGLGTPDAFSCLPSTLWRVHHVELSSKHSIQQSGFSRALPTNDWDNVVLIPTVLETLSLHVIAQLLLDTATWWELCDAATEISNNSNEDGYLHKLHVATDQLYPVRHEKFLPRQ